MRSLLPFRPVSVLQRLPPRSAACPLSLRHLLAAPGLPRAPLPAVIAPLPAVARATLRAAREAGAAVALAVPAGVDLAAWLSAVAPAAGEAAPGLPFAICAEVALAGADDAAVERAGLEAARLVEAGATHLAVDPTALPPAARAAAAADVAALASDREIGIELVLAPEEATAPERAAALALAFRGRGVALDAVGARCARPASEADVRAQARALALLARACGAPVSRHGPSTPGLLSALTGSPVRACDDGGATFAAGWRALSPEERAALEAGAARARREPGRPRPEAGGAEAAAAAERLEALAWSEATAFLDALGAAGSARSLAARFAGEGA